MRNRAFRSLAAIFSILLLTGIPAQAGPIVVSEVIQVLGSHQNPLDIRLRGVSQNSTALASGVMGSSVVKQTASDGSLDVAGTSSGAPVVTSTDSLLSGVDADVQPTVEVIDASDVEGTVCDCGEIPLMVGGFRKWPLLFLAVIPFFFIHDCHDCDAAAPQKQKFTDLTFVKTIQSIKNELAAGKNKYRNALLLANAYYNISYYGNARQFYEGVISGGFDIYSQKVAKKYYLLARANAQTNEQKARCTFMIAKCDQNEIYNQNSSDYRDGNILQDSTTTKRYLADFEDLRIRYNKTKFYQEVLHECGYFKSYIDSLKIKK